MSEGRLKYGEFAPEGLEKMRVSLMNGCDYCIHLHTAELKELNETAERITGVAEWRGVERLYAAGAGCAGMGGGFDEYSGMARAGCFV